jgi:predicted PurR-regulated permease PerM
MSRMVSFIALIAVILVIGFLFFRVMSPFLLPVFMATLLVVIFQPLHVRVLARCRGRERWAAAITTGLIFLIVLLPLLLVVVMAAAEGTAMAARLDPMELREKVGRARDKFELLRYPHADHMRQIESEITRLERDVVELKVTPQVAIDIANIQANLDHLRTLEAVTTADTGAQFDATDEALTNAAKLAQVDAGGELEDALHSAGTQFHKLKLELLGGEFRTWIKESANPTPQVVQHSVRKLLADFQGWLFSIGGRTTALAGKIVVDLLITVVAAFFFLAEGPRMTSTLMRLSPLDDRYERELLNDFSNVSRAVVMATLLSALAQGLLGGVGYYFAGFHSVILMAIFTGLLAMIPFIGAAAVWLPASLWLYFVEERALAAVLLAVYGVAVVSSIDNLIKPLVLHGRSRLHPLLALLSVLGGVNALGPVGILVGPMIVAFLQTLLNILHRELTQFDSDRRIASGHFGKPGSESA